MKYEYVYTVHQVRSVLKVIPQKSANSMRKNKHSYNIFSRIWLHNFPVIFPY